jgi:hypothetical protein
MFADVAEVGPLTLAAQVRDRLLLAAQPLFPAWAADQQSQIDLLRQTTAEFPESERLASRVEHLREMAAQLRDLAASLPTATVAEPARQRLQKALEIADKLLADRADLKAKDRLVSGVDSDARVGWHHQYYTGYSVDISMDADSEIITAINVLPGNGAEAADAITLIKQEEAAQGNDVKGMSIDGAGYNGPMLRELTDPNGLNLDVTVPPPQPMQRTTFGPERFTLRIINDEVGEVTCPNGQTTQKRSRSRHDTGFRYRFKHTQCAGCPLRAECLENPESTHGRVIYKNDYEAEYLKVEAKAKTPEYRETRRTHPKIERKLGELARHHHARRARFRGLTKVLAQTVLTALVVNVKRMVKLLAQKTNEAASALSVRAEVTTT